MSYLHPNSFIKAGLIVEHSYLATMMITIVAYLCSCLRYVKAILMIFLAVLTE